MSEKEIYTPIEDFGSSFVNESGFDTTTTHPQGTHQAMGNVIISIGSTPTSEEWEVPYPAGPAPTMRTSTWETGIGAMVV